MQLTQAQRSALEFARQTARSNEVSARRRVAALLHGSACDEHSLAQALNSISASAPVILHFHPDRYSQNGCTVAEALLDEGLYRNQYETGLSAGSRSAFAGGSRDRWERALFGAAYHAEDVLPGERPKYGVLELVRYPDGPLPRFGSCYFVLRPHVVARCTFTHGGSEQRGAIDRFGTSDHLLPVFAALLEEIAAGGQTPVKWPPFRAPTLGLRDISVCSFLARVVRELATPRDFTAGVPGRVLDSGIEAHVHGTIELATDAGMLVADPSFDGTSTGEVLTALAAKYGLPVHWHCGFRLHAEDVPDDFRGPQMRPLALRIARNGFIDAAAIGAAEATLHTTPELWLEWGTRDMVLQYLKQLWHVLVHYGHPIHTSAV